MFEIETEEERELVVAAIACARRGDKPVDFVEISRERLETYGTISDTMGTTPLARANVLHRSLDWDAATLERLANDLLNEKVKATRVKPADVRAIVGRLDPEEVEGEQAKRFVQKHHPVGPG